MSRPWYGWVVVGLWLSSTLSGFVVVFNIGILLPSIAEDMGLSPGQQGLLGSAAFWGNLFLAIPLGWWTTRFSPKAVIASTLALGTLLILLQGWSPAFAVLLIGRLCFGVALLAMEPPGAALISQWFPPHRIVFVNSVANVVFSLTMGLGLLATPLILGALGGDWRMSFYVSGFLFALLTIAWLLFGRDRHRTRRQSDGDAGDRATAVSSTTLRTTLAHRDLLLACIGMAGAVLAWSAFLSFFPSLMLERYGVSLNWSGAFLAINLAVGGVSGMVMAFVVARTRRVNPILMLIGLSMTGGYAAMTLTGSIPLLVLFSAISGLSGAYFPLLYSVAFQLRGVTADRIPVAVATVMTAVSLGTLLGPMLTGFLQEAIGDLRLPLIIASGAGLVLLPVGALITIGHTGESAAGQQEEVQDSVATSEPATRELL